MKSSLELNLSGLAIATCLFITSQASASETKSDGVATTSLSAIDRSSVEESLTKQLRSQASKTTKLPGQKMFDVKAHLSSTKSKLTIELGRDAVPDTAGADSEEQCSSFATTARYLLRGEVSVTEYECTYGGKSIYFYHPEPGSEKKKAELIRPAEDPLPLLLLAAGHGLYIKHIGTNSEWSYQRDAKNGMLEDKTTPGYATAVNSALTANGSQVNTALVRSESTAIHTPSGKPWWEVSAKYYLMDLLPDQSKIWASIPNDKTSVEREKNEDIRSRPLYGNYLKASYGLNIHTNAENSGKIRGTIGFYQPNHPFSEQSKLLTSKVVCSMKEIINSDAAYEQWDVDTAPRGEDKGENRVANYPSTIIEVGFHTNAADAIALQNTKFRTLASKGMAKGVKLYKEGKECAPFKIDSIPTVSGPIGTPFDYKINYSGNPAFPVKMYFEVVSCQSGWSCSGGTRTVNVVSSPLTFQISCTGKTTAGTFVYRRWLEDADGVKTAPVDHTYSCVPPKSKMASPVIADESIGITNS